MNKKQASIIDSLPSLESVAGGKGKSEIPAFDNTVLPQEVVDAVDAFLAGAALVAQGSAQQDEAKPVINATGASILDDLANQDSFCKSVKLVGSQGQVTVTRTDKFSIPDTTDIKTLEENFGKEFVSSHFAVETEVVLNPKVLKDNKLLKELIDAVGASNFGKFFVKVQTVVAQKGLDKELFNLPPEKRELCRAGIVKQAAASIKVG